MNEIKQIGASLFKFDKNKGCSYHRNKRGNYEVVLEGTVDGYYGGIIFHNAMIPISQKDNTDCGRIEIDDNFKIDVLAHYEEDIPLFQIFISNLDETVLDYANTISEVNLEQIYPLINNLF